jgi:hypothetical protein
MRNLEYDDLERKNVIFEHTAAWIEERGITELQYEGEEFPGQFDAQRALMRRYHNGFMDGYDQSDRRWRNDLTELQRSLNKGEITLAEIAVDDLGYARGIRERQADSAAAAAAAVAEAERLGIHPYPDLVSLRRRPFR